MGQSRSRRPGRRILVALTILAVPALAGCAKIRSTSEEASSQLAVATNTTESAALSAATTPPPAEVPAGICEGQGTIVHRNIAYDVIDGVDPNLLSLDVYEPARSADCPAAPIMVYVHGGAWSIGDKTGTVDDKISWFNQRGWVFVSVNYRLSPVSLGADSTALDPARIKYPIHNDDVATAIAWVHDNAARYGADADALSIMGHSAGAGIIAAIATDERYLGDHGLGLGTIRCAVPLDTAAYDIRARAESGLTKGLYLNAFGTVPETWDDASPINHVASGKDIPDFFIVTRGSASRVSQARDFAAVLTEAGVSVRVLRADGLDHAGVNRAIGSPGDSLITPELGRFLEGCR